MMRTFMMSWMVVAALMMGCSDGAGTGTLEITTYGEDYIEQEIPSGGEGFVDGWSLTFSKFLVSLSSITIEDQSGEVAAEELGPYVFDLHQPGPHLVVSFDEISAKRWDRVSFSIEPPSASAVGGNANEEDSAMMRSNHNALYVEGSATNGTEALSFAWSFDTATTYEECHHDDFGEGVVVPSGGSLSAEITIHGDHLFYDDLQAPDAVLRFEAIAAADENDDGAVTLEELALVDLTTLPEGSYGTGGAGEVEDLGAFIAALTGTLGHWRGEGHCHSGSTQAH